MSLLALVSLAAFCVMGYMTQQNMLSSIEGALSSAIDGDAKGSDLPFIGHNNSGERGNNAAVPAYSVTVTWDGSIYADKNLVTQMDEDVLKSAVATAVNSCHGSAVQGSIPAYSLYFKIVPKDLGYRIAFVDSSSYDAAIQAIFISFGLAWLVLMVVLFAITMFLARFVARPVEAAWENQQRFIADASHELKTPLTVIMADASILQKSPEKTVAEQKDWVEGISSEAERMRRLTEDLLALAQADAGIDTAPVMTELDFSQMTERAVLQFEAAAFERGLLIEDEIEEGVKVSGAADKLDGMLKTLLENACKYGAGSGEPVRVKLARDKTHAILSVSNGGVSIPPEDLAHVFDRFYRSDKSRTKEGESASFGLGLAIAKSTAELHRGSIAAASSNGITTFTVKLPLAK